MKKLTRKTILNDTMWAVELDEGCGRHWITGNWNKVKPLFDSHYLSDIDFAAVQPEHLIEFYDAYWKYRKENHCNITVEQFYKITFES